MYELPEATVEGTTMEATIVPSLKAVVDVDAVSSVIVTELSGVNPSPVTWIESPAEPKFGFKLMPAAFTVGTKIKQVNTIKVNITRVNFTDFF